MQRMLTQLIQATKGHYEILSEETGNGLGIFCKDHDGKLVASRTVSHGQLRNSVLLETVMTDLQRTLLNRVGQ